MEALSRLGLPACLRRARIDNEARACSERGASLTEYALILGLVVSVSIGVIGTLTETSGSYLEATGDDIGTARLENEFIPDELPPEPEWPDLPVDNEAIGGGPDADSSLILSPLFGASSRLCFTSATPGTVGSEISHSTCDASPAQEFNISGADINSAIIQFTGEIAGDLCFASNGGAGSPVVQNACDGTDGQQWKVEQGAAVVIRSVADSTLCLDERSGRLTLEVCDFNPSQQFN